MSKVMVDQSFSQEQLHKSLTGTSSKELDPSKVRMSPHGFLIPADQPPQPNQQGSQRKMAESKKEQK